MRIQFTKMHGLGNDFVVINTISHPVNLSNLDIPTFANRHVGVGFDQLLLIEPSQSADYFCRIYNADGSVAKQCGNGLRCVARFLHETKMHAANSMRIETIAGIYPVTIQDYDHITVTMGAPTIQENLIEIAFNPHPLPISILSVGNPHAILKVNSTDETNAEKLGSQISTHAYFPEGANVGFMQIIDRKHIRLRTYERGAGETCACGSNACAAVVAGIANQWLDHEVTVQHRYGTLNIQWPGSNHPIQMTGPAATVFDGVIG